MNKNEDSINFGNKQKFMKRIEKLIDNIGEFYLDYYMYKAASEVLIYIDIFLYNCYVKTSNFKDAELVLEKMKNYNNLFEDKAREKINKLLYKIMFQFANIYSNNVDHLKPALLFKLASEHHGAVPPPYITELFKGRHDLKFLNFNPNKKLEEASSTFCEKFVKYSRIANEMYYPYQYNGTINLVKNITNEINKDRLVYHFNYNDKEYAFIEK